MSPWAVIQKWNSRAMLIEFWLAGLLVGGSFLMWLSPAIHSLVAD
jgi:hypothetical protein